MKKLLRIFFAFAASSALFCGVPAVAAPEGATATYAGLDDASHISGPKVSAASLKGKVVLWEYWGLQCPPCLAAMPHLQALYKKYGARGHFVVIGSHVQLKSPAVEKYVREKGITFPIYQWAAVSEAPVAAAGAIPYSVLIGADGKIVKAGVPQKIYDAVETEMKKVSKGYPIFPDFKASRYKSVADSLVYGGKNLEGKVAALAGKNDDEAKSLAKAFSRWKKGELAALKKLLTEDPLAALDIYDELKESLPESTKEFAAQVAEIRKDKMFAAVADLRKKADKLEQKKSAGKKVSESEVASLKKKLSPLLADSRESVRNAAKDLDSRLSALQKK